MHQKFRCCLPAARFGRLSSPALWGLATWLGIAGVAHAVDTANPTVTLTAPTVNANYSSLSSITGTATDDTGLKRVDVYIYRSYTGVKQYFNFSTRVWAVATPASLAVTPDPNTTGNPTSLSWSATGVTWPTSTEMPAGEYNVEVRSVDTSNKTSAYSRPLFSVGTPDATAPTASFTSPTADVTDDHIPTIWSATANDGTGSGVGYVQFSISRKFSATTEYWSGNTTNHWVTAKTTKTLNPGAPDGNGDQSWSYALNAGDWTAPTGADLPQGQYTATYNVYDRYGNARTINRTVNILPLDTIKPESVLTGLKTPSKSDPETTAPTGLSGYSYDPLDENGVASGIATVALGIFRTWNGTTLYWDGSGWTAGVKTYALTVGAPDVNGHCAWNFPPSGVTMPTLAQGAYTIRVNTNDRYGNAFTLQQSLYVGPGDATAPEVTNVTASTTANALNSVSVTATDADSGIMRMEVTISRVRAGVSEWWTGSAWSTTTTRFSPTLNAASANTSVTWSSATGLPAGASLPSGTTDLPAGTYNIGVTVADRYLNSNSILSPFTVTNASGVADTTAPTVSITAPTNNAILSSLSNITGTAADEGAPSTAQTGLSEVRVVLTRILESGNLNWNGSAWVSSTAILSPRSASGSSTTWSRTGLPSGTDLPGGQYSITATAFDQTLNASDVATVNFTVNNKPVAQAQSVTATGRVNTDGDPAAITLSATDADGDSMQSWQVATQPQHGTLTGTAPNLTYIAEQGYFGSDSFTFTANDGTQESEPATVSITVSAPPPVDALIKNSGAADYIGDNVISTDGTNETVGQEIGPGGTATYLVKVQKEIAAASLVLKVLGTGESGDWTVRYFDAVTNGLDITSQVTGANGWKPVLSTGEKEFRIEVTAPAELSAEADLALLVSAQQDGTSAPGDVVKANTVAWPIVQPDLEIKLASDANYVGANVLNLTGLDQTRGVDTAPVGTVQVFSLKATNKETFAGKFNILGAGTIDGWQLKYYDALTDGSDITAQVANQGWSTGVLAAGASKELRIEVTPTTDVRGDGVFSITGSCAGVKQDVVKITAMLPQFIEKLQWSIDAGDNWQDVPASGAVQVVQGVAVSLRAVKGRPALPWPSDPDLKPEWTDVAHDNAGNLGDRIAVQFDDVTGMDPFSLPLRNEIRAECGNIVTARVQVVPYCEVEVWAEDETVATPAPGATAQTQVTALVTDWMGIPLPGIRVHFSTTVGQINGEGTADDEAVTDADGYATVDLTSDAAGNGQITASAVVDAGVTGGDADVEVDFE